MADKEKDRVEANNQLFRGKVTRRDFLWTTSLYVSGLVLGACLPENPTSTSTRPKKTAGQATQAFVHTNTLPNTIENTSTVEAVTEYMSDGRFEGAYIPKGATAIKTQVVKDANPNIPLFDVSEQRNIQCYVKNPNGSFSFNHAYIPPEELGGNIFKLEKGPDGRFEGNLGRWGKVEQSEPEGLEYINLDPDTGDVRVFLDFKRGLPFADEGNFSTIDNADSGVIGESKPLFRTPAEYARDIVQIHPKDQQIKLDEIGEIHSIHFEKGEDGLHKKGKAGLSKPTYKDSLVPLSAGLSKPTYKDSVVAIGKNGGRKISFGLETSLEDRGVGIPQNPQFDAEDIVNNWRNPWSDVEGTPGDIEVIRNDRDRIAASYLKDERVLTARRETPNILPDGSVTLEDVAGSIRHQHPESSVNRYGSFMFNIPWYDRYDFRLRISRDPDVIVLRNRNDVTVIEAKAKVSEKPQKIQWTNKGVVIDGQENTELVYHQEPIVYTANYDRINIDKPEVRPHAEGEYKLFIPQTIPDEITGKKDLRDKVTEFAWRRISYGMKYAPTEQGWGSVLEFDGIVGKYGVFAYSEDFPFEKIPDGRGAFMQVYLSTLKPQDHPSQEELTEASINIMFYIGPDWEGPVELKYEDGPKKPPKWDKGYMLGGKAYPNYGYDALAGYNKQGLDYKGFDSSPGGLGAYNARWFTDGWHLHIPKPGEPVRICFFEKPQGGPYQSAFDFWEEIKNKPGRPEPYWVMGSQVYMGTGLRTDPNTVFKFE